MIDYKLINDSIEHYENLGFQRVESPWTVTEQVDSITRPKNATVFQLKHNDKCLVASGEQSFLYLYLKNFLPKGRFQTVTPCFRYESFDFLHTKYFIKNELIKTDAVTNSRLEEIINGALLFYRQYFPRQLLSIVDTQDGYDIMLCEKYELGSYGIRECEFLKWIYGTGCAEPRTSNLIKIYGISPENYSERNIGEFFKDKGRI